MRLYPYEVEALEKEVKKRTLWTIEVMKLLMK